MKTRLIIGMVIALGVSTTQVWPQSHRPDVTNPPALTVQQWIQGDSQTTTVLVNDDRWMAMSGARSGMELLEKILQSAAASDSAQVRRELASYAAPGGPFGYCEYDWGEGIDAGGNCGINWCKTCYNDFTHEWLGSSCKFITIDPMWCN